MDEIINLFNLFDVKIRIMPVIGFRFPNRCYEPLFFIFPNSLLAQFDLARDFTN